MEKPERSTGNTSYQARLRLSRSGAGFVAMGPDGLSSLRGYPGNDDEGRKMQRSLDGGALLNDFSAGFGYLQALDGMNGKVGATGFCYGGGVVQKLAVAYPCSFGHGDACILSLWTV